MTNAEARFNNSLRPRKPEGSLGRTAQDGHLDSHTTPELCREVGGKGEIIYLSLHCHHQNDSCIKTGNDESHFNVSVGSDGQSHKTVATSHNLFEDGRRTEAVSNRGPSSYQPNALPLVQTGSQIRLVSPLTAQSLKLVLRTN